LRKNRKDNCIRCKTKGRTGVWRVSC